MSVQENLESISIKELIGKALAKWYLFVIALAIALPLAFLYTQTLTSSFEVKAKLSLADKSSSQMASKEGIKELAYLEQSADLEDKIQVLTSFTLVKKAVEQIPFEIAYYEKKTLSSIRVYQQEAPFYVIVDSTRPQLLDVPISVEQDEKGFKLSFEVEKQAAIYDLQTGEKLRGLGPMELTIYSDENGAVVHDFINVEIVPSLEAEAEIDGSYAFKMRSINSLAGSFQEKLEVSSVSEESSVVTLKSGSSMPWEDELFINTLMQTYIRSEIEKRQRKGQATLDTISRELSYLSDSLAQIQGAKAGIQSGLGVIDPGMTESTLFNQKLNLRDRRTELVVQKRRYEALLERMRSTGENSSVMPSSQDVDDVLLRELLVNLSSLFNQRSNLAGTVNQNSRTIQDLDRQINQTRLSIIQNIEDRIASVNIEIEETNLQLGQVSSEISSIPGASNQITSIADQIELLKNRYDYLSQKRSELLIALSSLDVDYFVIDEARPTGESSGTSKGLVMIIAMIVGMGIPVAFIIVQEFFNDNLLTYKELRQHTKIPILGMVITNDTPYPTLRPDTTDSALAECFRALRIHIYKNIPDEAREQICTIGVVSTWSGEGKSFCAANMAASLSMAGYKTLIVDLDLRNPNQTRHFDYEPERGISNTLPGSRRADLEGLLQPTHIPSLDIVAAGPVYHNPLDLFDGPAFRQLIEQAREKYDFVILDLPPIAQASDYLLVSEYLDYTLYVARHHVTKVSDLDRINELYEEGKIKHIGLVMNGVANPSYFRYGDMSYYNIGRYKSRYNSAYTAS